MIDILKRNSSNLLSQAMEHGADEAQVIATHTVTSKVGYEKNDFNITSVNTKSSLSLKVHKDMRKGTATTNETGDKALGETASRAISLSGFSLEDEHLTLPTESAPEDLPGRFDPALQNLSAADLHRVSADFVAAARQEPRLSLDGGGMEVATTHQVVVNSHGLSVSDRTTSANWYLMGMGKSGEEVTSFDYDGGSSWSWADTPSRTKINAEVMTGRLMSNFGARKGESYKGQVLLSPAAIAELLFGTITFQISGQQIMDGKSRWEDSLGEKIAHEKFTLTDNPFNLQLGGATPYDGEGVAVKPMVIIDSGVLQTHIDSSYSAHRRGTKSTGHTGGLHGIELTGGDATKDELIGQADRLVVVERFSGNADPITGDFSGVAKCSHYYKSGEHQHPLTETMIAGNVFEMLKNVVDLSREREAYFNYCLLPWLLVDGISVTAG